MSLCKQMKWCNGENREDNLKIFVTNRHLIQNRGDNYYMWTKHDTKQFDQMDLMFICIIMVF